MEHLPQLFMQLKHIELLLRLHSKKVGLRHYLTEQRHRVIKAILRRQIKEFNRD